MPPTRLVLLIALLLALPLACADSDDPAAPAPPAPTPVPSIGEPTFVVPSDGLPSAVRDELQNANNNLDAILHEGRFFLAFRSAPTHFASETAVLYVVSSTDRTEWELETRIHIGRDLREPRLLSLDGTLFLYFATLGSDPLDFEPGDMRVTERLGPGAWTEPVTFYGEGFIPWRTKTLGGVAYMLAYEGGENIYDIAREPIDVHWLTTDNGLDWEPVVPGRPVVLRGGGSETDFVFLEDGSLVAVSRNEMGGEMGWGMMICRAEADSLGEWACVSDPKKYDSPLLFRHGSEVYLLGRRNLTETGNYDLFSRDLPDLFQTLAYELDYWLNAKRCSLWRVDPETLAVELVFDLPSCGDTCFPALVHLGGGDYLIYNYTSPLEHPDYFWLQGQLNPTLIYSVPLAFRPPPG